MIYKLICEDNIDSFSKAINTHFVAGWKLKGNPFCVPNVRTDLLILQGMIMEVNGKVIDENED